MPLVSIIIPTHNRAHYAIPTISSLLTISPDIEVVISDTSEIDLISPKFSEHPDFSRLKIIRPGQALSVVDNFNIATKAATGDFLVFIGDDDIVLSNVVDVAMLAKKQAIESIGFTTPILYFWPDFIHATQGDHYAGKLYISAYSKKIDTINAKETMRKPLDNFGGGVFKMPRAYGGMISRNLLERIETKYGALFGGVSPDIYSAALIATESNSTIQIDFPVVVPGASGASTAGQSANRKHVGGLRDNAHIGAFKNLVWDERIPEFYSVPTVWSYSLLKALEATDQVKPYANFARLYVKCLIFQFPYRGFIVKSLKHYVKNVGLVKATLSISRAIFLEGLDIATKIFSKLKNRFITSTSEAKSGFANTYEASAYLNANLPSLRSIINQQK